MEEENKDCPACKGTGKIEGSAHACEFCGWSEYECDECEGTGKVKDDGKVGSD